MATAADIVNRYLEKQRAGSASTRHTEITKQATLEIVDALPDGFTAKDARTCVKELLEGNTDVDGLTTNARGRVVTKTLNDAVNAGSLTVDEDGKYAHGDPTASVTSASPVAAPPPR
jgi:hypothetical protein